MIKAYGMFETRNINPIFLCRSLLGYLLLTRFFFVLQNSDKKAFGPTRWINISFTENLRIFTHKSFNCCVGYSSSFTQHSKVCLYHLIKFTEEKRHVSCVRILVYSLRWFTFWVLNFDCSEYFFFNPLMINLSKWSDTL